MTALHIYLNQNIVKEGLLCLVDSDSIVGLIEFTRHETAFNLQIVLFPSAPALILNTTLKLLKITSQRLNNHDETKRYDLYDPLLCILEAAVTCKHEYSPLLQA